MLKIHLLISSNSITKLATLDIILDGMEPSNVLDF